MNINNNNLNQLDKSIDKTDGLTARNILNLLALKDVSAWFNEEPPISVYKTDLIQFEEILLSFEQVKELYPEWFKS